MSQATISAAAGQQPAGYMPHAITLTGFRGIRSGLGRDSISLDLDSLLGDAVLVAIGGANGRGKTTLMDNLHPYLVMPSRAGADGLGAFSYYDHVYLPESQKELVWSHGGVRYKTHLVFRVNGKRKTEAFLFESVAGGWKPVVLADGTPVDGKVDTYERAVCEILGPSETFFASVFSAQGKRPLSAYKNGEIKTLLADLLGLVEVRAQGSRAAEVAKLLKAGLGVVRQEQAQAAETQAALESSVKSGGEWPAKVDAARQLRERCAGHETEAKGLVARLESEGRAAEGTEGRRAQVQAAMTRASGEHDAALGRLSNEATRIGQRQEALRQRVATRCREYASRRQRLQGQLNSHRLVVARTARVQWAIHRLPVAERVVAAREEGVRASQAEVARLEGLRAQQGLLRQGIDALDREAGQLAVRQADLARRFGLVERVPCAGTDLQGRCQLLGDAREAQALVPSVEAQLAAVGTRKQQALRDMETLATELSRFSTACERRNRCEALLDAAQARHNALALLAATAGELRQARDALVVLEEELNGLPADVAAETTEEATERAEHEASLRRLDEDKERSIAAHTQALAGFAEQLQALPAPFDQARLAQARRAAGQVTEQLRSAEAAELAAVRQHEQWLSQARQLEALGGQRLDIDERVSHVERELSAWTLLSKCLSNDGVIALDIDDAGPTFSALANDLLLACYGARFTLEVITQTETAKGELREDFDIVVHDGLRGESKSLKLVSGGERVWINECLTRAIALYLAGNTGRQYGTLFCDEADGPLDPEHKRMFMDMKREVLRLGHYAREFYVSQTPELNAMADCVIDLDALVMDAMTTA